jgi:hypothetical protein
MTLKQIEFAKTESRKLDNLSFEIEKVARDFRGMGGGSADLIVGILIGAKESINRIGFRNLQDVATDNAKQIEEEA